MLYTTITITITLACPRAPLSASSPSLAQRPSAEEKYRRQKVFCIDCRVPLCIPINGDARGMVLILCRILSAYRRSAARVGTTGGTTRPKCYTT